MRLLLSPLIFLVASGASAQGLLENTHACGRADVKVHIELDPHQQAPSQPPTGEALLYFLQQPEALPHPLSPVFLGLDGRWVGAYKESSWIAVPVAPGDHLVCAFVRGTEVPEIQHQTFEAGRTYYLRTREIVSETGQYLTMDTVSAEQAKFMLTIYPASTFTLTP